MRSATWRERTHKTRYTEADDPKRLIAIAEAFHRGVDLYGARRFDEAIQCLPPGAARRPDMAIAYRHLAFVEWERGDLAGASRFCSGRSPRRDRRRS